MASVLFVAFGVVAASLSFDTYDDHCPGVAYRLLKGQGLGGQFACSAGETRRFLIAVLLTVVGVCVGAFVGVYRWRTRGESGRPKPSTTVVATKARTRWSSVFDCCHCASRDR